MYRVELLSKQQFRHEKNRWNELTKLMTRPSVFCTWEWIHTWSEHFGDNYKLVILYVYDADILIGILPLSKSRMIVEDGVLAGEVLTYCGSIELCSDHIDVICKHEHVDNCMFAVLDFLKTSYRDWNLIHLSHLPVDSEISQWIFRFNNKIYFDKKNISEALYINTDKSFDEYAKTLKGNKRRDLNRLRRNLYEKFDVRYEKYSPAVHENGIELLFELHNKRAISKNLKTAFRGDKLLEFHKEVSGLFYTNGWLRLRFLMNYEDAVAANYCFEFENRMFGYQQGIDPEWEKKSVGNIIIYELIKEACEEDIAEFDLLRGGGKHKSLWGSGLRELINVNIYNNNSWSHILRLTYSLRNKLAKSIKTFYFNKNR